jgi:5'-nucleotidase
MHAHVRATHLIAVASSAVFDLGAADAFFFFRDQGREAYRCQREHERQEIPRPWHRLPIRPSPTDGESLDPLASAGRGGAISRNDPDTGVRVRNSLDHHGLAIHRTVFTGGRPHITALICSKPAWSSL